MDGVSIVERTVYVTKGWYPEPITLVKGFDGVVFNITVPDAEFHSGTISAYPLIGKSSTDKEIFDADVSESTNGGVLVSFRPSLMNFATGNYKIQIEIQWPEEGTPMSVIAAITHPIELNIVETLVG